MTTKEELISMKKDITSINEKVDNIASKLDMLTDKLLNPDSGVTARVNRNTAMRKSFSQSNVGDIYSNYRCYNNNIYKIIITIKK